MLHLFAKTPRVWTPETLATLGFAAVSTSVASALLGGGHLSSGPSGAVLLATASASAVLVRWIVRREQGGDVAALVGAMVVGTGLWGGAFAFEAPWGVVRGVAFGATIGLVPSVACGVILAVLARAVHSARTFATHDADERVGLVAGASAGLAGAMATGFASRPWIVVPIASALLGLALLVATWRRDGRRAAWLRDVFAGKLDGYRVLPIDELDLREHVSPLVPGASADAVLVADARSAAPYREAPRAHPVALVGRCAASSLAPLRARTQRAGLLVALIVALGVTAVGAQVRRAHAQAARRAAADAAPVACLAARVVFERRAMEEGPAPTALMMTHAQDPAIAEGEARLYVPEKDPAVEANIRRAVAAIPCADKPKIDVLAGVERPFDVEARLTIDEGDSPELVARAAREAIAASFALRRGAAGALAGESVRFGYYDRRVRWRVAAALGETFGVRSYELSIDGERDRALRPEEIAVPRHVVLIDAATGAPL
jgi:hypothetical protein